ncbi:MAG: hypothetical protein A2087_07455 [Spirochaetes bacterium GWD1_61_31]|nr:MAG: hypothetical protein A2Y37_08015 [Spirochaetes bacterium GWB1_60_80]OHD34247.1 MAG: hypothetical protein A2004_12735 [Spirochaetes bacterium GWC1_61_12]OHD40175.1 MAG: hypothetical protein A2087_07455 [Spirochaetes bacterium GWD1_61_31]OHD45777.1 MAG: hypothetical protein A2Y35_03650 [Spirochaetes bacterium GWE1_60_18]OHD58321.1 MAG: hypothetical protein A2Y32_06040 [Spirochaetes bacterium GWF1_60_12]HAX37765.1 hypothetical protein [Spirochaetaceae bacterium]
MAPIATAAAPVPKPDTADKRRFHPKTLLAKAKHYLQHDAKADLSAGLTVAVLGIPQAMAFATIAGLPPVTGLYTSIVPCILAALLGSSRHLVTGPSNVTCMMIYGITAQLAAHYTVNPLEVALLLAFLSGLLQILFGFLRLGAVVKYISNSVVLGFTTGAACLIAINQLRDFLAINLPRSADAHTFVSLWETISAIGHVNLVGLLIALVTLALVLLCKRFWPRLPAPLLILIVASLAVAALGLAGEAAGAFRVAIIGDGDRIAGSLAMWRIPALLRQPSWGLWRGIIVGSFSVAILGLIQSATIARSIATRSGQRLDFNREFIAQGVANTVGSFFQCFPSAGSFNRSAVCFQAHGRTRLAPLLSGVIAALFLLWLGPLTNYVPRPAFAGLLMATAWFMVDRSRLGMIWRTSQHSRWVLLGTLAATLLLSLEYAIFIGVFLSVAGLLQVTGKPYITQLTQRPDGAFEEVPFKQAGRSPISLINLEGYFYFASVDDLDYELLQCLTPETRVVVLRMKRLRAFGSSTMTMLDHLHDLLSAQGIHLVACGVNKDVGKSLTDSGIRAKLGEQNIFQADNRLFLSTELALARAQALVLAKDGQPATKRTPSGPTTAAALKTTTFLRFGMDHQLREALWLFNAWLDSGRAGSRPTVFLQNQAGKMAGAIGLRRILGRLADIEAVRKHPEASNEQLAAWIRSDYIHPITAMASAETIAVNDSADLPAIMLAALRNPETCVPVLDDEGRMSGVIQPEVLLGALAKAINRLDADKPVKSRS